MQKADYAQQPSLPFSASLFDQEDGRSEDDLLGDEELLTESQITDLADQLDSPDSPDSPDSLDTPDILNISNPVSGLLDESSLETILDMLAVMTSIEELMLLESLTDAQKRQVWSVTPETVRSKLKQIREAGLSEPEDSELEDSEPEDRLSEYATSEEFATSVEYEPEDFFSEDCAPEDWENLAPKLGDSNQPTLSIGNQVVLIAQPKLTTAELIAIWDVVEVHGKSARIKATHLGVRNYPVSWMVVYPTSH